ncbi:MAG: CoA-binding protein [Chloroflexota bacterium]
MTTGSTLEDFVNQRTLAVVGVSRRGQKFGNMAYRELKTCGYRLFPVHPQAETIEGDRAYPDFKSLPEKVDGVLVIVPPEQAEKVVREAVKAGIKRLWLQQGAESEAAIGHCQENNASVVYGECILMFARNTAWYHRAHRWVWGLLGKLPR